MGRHVDVEKHCAIKLHIITSSTIIEVLVVLSLMGNIENWQYSTNCFFHT